MATLTVIVNKSSFKTCNFKKTTYLHDLAVIRPHDGDGFALVVDDPEGGGEPVVPGDVSVSLHGIPAPDTHVLRGAAKILVVRNVRQFILL